MKKSLAHLPQLKQDELELIAMMIRSLCEDVHMVVLFGSYARGDLAADYCPQLASILPRDTDKEKEFFGLLDYAYIGARYDINYKITKQQLEQLAPCVKKLHKVTENICKEKIKSFV
jgi:hypothetical protein